MSGSGMRKPVISNCEKQFLLKNLTKWTRLDGRAFDEFREVKIEFGKDWGCCFVFLGQTKVLAQVSCELQQPKSSRPSEGVLNLNIELNPMADCGFEAGRQSDQSAQLNRLLEKCLKDSKAVDLESLCVKMNEKVWAVRVDINVLNNEGNILDCASIAALAALTHFRRPDVTCDGEEFTIHSYKQRDPIPMVIHHYPVCVSYAVFSDVKLKSDVSSETNKDEEHTTQEKDFILADPNLLEERVADAFLCIGLNSYKELCGLHLGGNASLATGVILEVTRKAASRAGTVVQLIKDVVENDNEKRKTNKESGFHNIVQGKTLEESLEDLNLCLDPWIGSKKKTKKKKKKRDEPHTEENEINKQDNKEKMEEEILKNVQQPMDLELAPNAQVWSVSDSEESENEVVCIETPKPIVEIIDSGSSEEETVVVLNADKKTNKKRKKSKS